MEQKLVLKKVRFDPWMDKEDEFELMEEQDEESPWEQAFQRGVKLANDEMVDDWYNEDEFE